MIINYYRHCSFIVLATVIKIINYDRKTFIVQATGKPNGTEKLSTVGLLNVIACFVKKVNNIFEIKMR